MKTIFNITILFCLITTNIFSQIKVNNLGYVGIGTTNPTARFHLKGITDGVLKLENGNGAYWTIGSYNFSPWSAANTLAICNSANYPKMEFRPSETYIHDKLTVGIGYTGNAPTLNLAEDRFMYFRALSSTTGLLFHEAETYTKNSVKYGAKIEYNEDNDNLVIGTYNNNIAYNSIILYRNNGNVGIGGFNNSLDYKLKVWGGMWTDAPIYQASDKRWKENIQTLTNNTQKLKQIRGVTYTNIETLSSNFEKTIVTNEDVVIDSFSLKKVVDKYPQGQKKEFAKTKYGFVAQEVQKLYPDLVHEDSDGYLAVNYIGFIPILVESVKEQQVIIENLEIQLQKKNESENNVNKEISALQKQILDLQNQITNIESNCCTKTGNVKLKSETTNQLQDASTNNTLSQNSPNPWNTSTQITVSLSNSVTNASICIYDMNGKQIRCYKISERGETSIAIHAEELQAGMYLYSLLADGALIDTKKMVLTE